jgi:NAD(P)-dependent dehydrogenase (short-subunit alcohol dehydrogenase family)
VPSALVTGGNSGIGRACCVAQGRGGRIVHVTSVHEHVPLEGSVGYVAGKHGLGGLTKVMACSFAPSRHAADPAGWTSDPQKRQAIPGLGRAST